MKIIILVWLVLLSTSSFGKTAKAPACTKDSDCAIGCGASKPTEADCLPLTEIKTKAVSEGPGDCRTGPGGLRCGCDKNACAFVTPTPKT